MAVRNVLHIKDLELFRWWLFSQGFTDLPLSQNPHEVLRARKRQRTIILFKTEGAKEHLSVMEKDFGLVMRFIKEKKGLAIDA